MCAAGGLMGRLGAAKRRMLSLAERPPSVEVAAWLGVFPLTGAAAAMVPEVNWGRVEVQVNGSRGCEESELSVVLGGGSRQAGGAGGRRW